MDLLDGESNPSAAPTNGMDPRGSRRTFIRRLIGGLAIAVPALRVLASSAPASASPDVRPCVKTYVVYEGHYCTSTGTSSCVTGDESGDCIGNYVVRDTYTGQICRRFTDVECRGCCGFLS
jgi:hypothetical protein